MSELEDPRALGDRPHPEGGVCAAAVARERDPERLVEVILDEMERLGANATLILTADSKERALNLVGRRGVSADLAAQLGRLSFDTPLVATCAAATRELQVVEDLATFDVTKSLTARALWRGGAASMIAAPLVSAGKLVGVLASAYDEPRTFPADEVAAIQAISDVFAASLAAALRHGYDRLQLESVRVAALAISTPFELGSVLQNIVDQARMLTGASYAALGIVDLPVRAAYARRLAAGRRMTARRGLKARSPP